MFNDNLIVDSYEILQFNSTTKGVDEKELNFFVSEILKKSEIPIFNFTHSYNRKKHFLELFVTCDDKEIKLDSKMFPHGIKMYIKEHYHDELYTVDVLNITSIYFV